jgi:hypothetical protein
MNRRSLFKAIAAGSLTAAHPLACLLTRNAMAQTGTAPIRTIFLFHPNGAVGDYFFPKAGSRVLPPMTAPLQEVYDNLVFMDGLTYPGKLVNGAHGEGERRCLTGRADSRFDTDSSIEVLMGKEDWVNRDKTRIRVPSIQMGVANWVSFYSFGISHDGDNKIYPVCDPRLLYQRLFSAPGALTNAADTQLLAAAKADLAVIRGRIGNIDGQRERLEQHAEALAFLEYKFANSGATPVAGCTWPNISAAPVFNVADTSLAWSGTEIMPLASDLQQDIAVSALSCGITKTIAFSYGVTANEFTRVPSSLREDHDASHDAPEVHTQSKKWWMAEVKKFIQKLANTPDQNGSLLDNTILVTVSDLGHGSTHDHWRIPMFLASGVNNNVGLVTGRSLDWRSSPLAKVQDIMGVSDIGSGITPASISHTEILDTIRQVAGYTSFKIPQTERGIMEAWTGGLEPR